jgi:hypothetical protein
MTRSRQPLMTYSCRPVTCWRPSRLCRLPWPHCRPDVTDWLATACAGPPFVTGTEKFFCRQLKHAGEGIGWMRCGGESGSEPHPSW